MKKLLLLSIVGIQLWAAPINVACADITTFSANRISIKEMADHFVVKIRQTTKSGDFNFKGTTNELATSVGVDAGNNIVEAVFSVPKADLTITEKGPVLVASQLLEDLEIVFSDYSGNLLGTGVVPSLSLNISNLDESWMRTDGSVVKRKISVPYIHALISDKKSIFLEFQISTHGGCRV